MAMSYKPRFIIQTKLLIMPHSYTRIWIHAVWATKERTPFINDKLEPVLYQFLKDQLKELACPVRIINGMPEHIHCLFLLNPQKSIMEIIKQIKGSSSHFINQNDFVSQKFVWQVGYSAFSVSDQNSDIIYNYIKNQKEHHRMKSFLNEYNELMKSNG